MGIEVIYSVSVYAAGVEIIVSLLPNMSGIATHIPHTGRRGA